MSEAAPSPISASPSTPAPSPLLRWVVAVAFFMQMLDSTILYTALPTIAKDLDVPPLATQSAVIAYLLTTALLMPASGWLAEHFGTRRISFLAIITFTLGSLLCAASPSLDLLAASRVVQGIGGALMVPVGRLTILRAYPRNQLIEVMSFITIPSLIGPLLGSLVGGFLVQYASWHWIFLFNLPAGILGLALARRCMPDFRGDTQWRFDFAGFVLFGLATVLLTFSMEGLGELRLPKIEVTLLCISGLMLFALYWVRAAHTEHPLFASSIFRVRTFAVGILGNLFARMGAGGMPFLLPLFLQLGLGYSPFIAGATMTPTALAGMLGKEVVPKLVARLGYRWFLSGNSLISVTMQIAMTCGVAMAAALLSGFNHATNGGAPSAGVFESTFLAVGGLTVLTGLIFDHISPLKNGLRSRRESATGNFVSKESKISKRLAKPRFRQTSLEKAASDFFNGLISRRHRAGSNPPGPLPLDPGKGVAPAPHQGDDPPGPAIGGAFGGQNGVGHRGSSPLEGAERCAPSSCPGGL